MLKKLLKYDLKYIFKLIVIFYCLSLFFGILTRIFFSFENSLALNIIGQVTSGAAISMMFSTIINNLMRLWVRIRTNFYGDESYLTHTLPVTRKTQLLSKLIASIITMFTSVLVVGLTLFIAYYSKENFMLLKQLVVPLVDMYDVKMVTIVISLFFILFLEFMTVLQSGYTGIILGHKKNSNKVGLSVLFGFIAYMVTQTVLVLMLFIISLFNKDLMNLFITNEMISLTAIKTIVYLSMIMYSLFNVVIYFVNEKLFDDGVNVD